MKEELKRNIQVNKDALQAIKKIDSARAAKFENGLLDEKSNSFISKYSDSVKQVITKHVYEDSVILSKRIKHRSADTLALRIKRITEEAKTNLGNIALIDELLATNTFTQLNTASVFGPGQFIIDLQANPSAADQFKKVAEDMLAFAAKFPGKKLTGTFMVLGYADAQQISAGSALDSTLRVSMGVETATSPQLNRELSRLRAKSVTEVLSGIMTQQTANGELYKKLQVEYLPQGRGEDYPNPKIKDYREDDERRRVVFVYWSILPDFD
ncbi:MAG: hypothetical protein QM725_08495 [Lacibacter sp.]